MTTPIGPDYDHLMKLAATAGAAAIAHYQVRLQALEHPYTFMAAISPAIAKGILNRAIAIERAALNGEEEDEACA